MTDAPLHPSLQKLGAAHSRLTRLLGLLFFLGMAAVLIFMMTVALSNRDLVNLLVFATTGLMMLPTMALMGGLLWYLQREMMRRLTDADCLLRENRPMTARLTPTGFNSKQGMLMAVHPLEARTSGGTGYVLIEPALGRSRSPSEDMTVQLYSRNLQPGSRLVALHNGNALLGKSVDRQKYLRQRRWMMITLATALWLVAIAMFLRM
jgi:hypothetical protein